MKLYEKIVWIKKLIFTTPHNILIIFLNLISGFLNVVGIPMLLPAIGYLSNDNVDQNSFHFKFVDKTFETIGIPVSFYTIIIFALILIFCSHLMALFIELFSRRIQIRIVNSYMVNLIESYNQSTWAWMSSDQSGKFHSAVSREATGASESHLDTLRFVASCIQLFSYILIVLIISFQFTMWACLFFIIISIPTIYYSNKLNIISNISNKHQILLSSYISNLTQNKKFFKASKNYQTFMKLITEQVKKVNKITWKSSLFDGGLRTFTVLSGMMFIISILLFYKQLSLTVPELLLLMLVFSRVVPQFNLLSNNFLRIFQSLPIYLSVNGRINNLVLNKEKYGEKNYTSFSTVTFKDVCFSYSDDTKVLDKTNLKILPKKTIAIVGSSGSGKSTLLDLFLGLLRTQSGKIIYGDIIDKELNYNSLRQKVAYVSQETTLLDGSLKYNLTIANPKASDEKILRVCEMAMLKETIDSFPNGLDTNIGENGVKLSGGQRQRVAIARALLNDPEFLILDEATSQLDLETEKYIRETIKKLSNNLTIIIVAHRISTVKDADIIYVLENGKVLEEGNFSTLIKKRGRLFELENFT